MVSRRTWFRLHQAIGLAAAIFVVLVSSTGAILTYRHLLKDAAPTAPAIASAVPLQTIVARAEAAGDGSPATDIELSQEPTQPYRVWLDDDAETEVYLDRAGRVLEVRRGAEGMGRFLFQLHTLEILGPGARPLAAIFGTTLLALVLSGVAMWWSRRRRGRRAAGPGT